MTKASINLQDLRRKIYIKAKTESHWRFWGLYVHVCKLDTLTEAYHQAKLNKGSPGLDGETFAMIEVYGVTRYLEKLCDELQAGIYKPQRNRKVKIPKSNGRDFRELNIPSIRDRIVQGALKLVLEPIFEANFQDGSYGYRPKRKPADAILRLSKAVLSGKTKVIDVDIKSYFDTVRHDVLLQKIAARVQDKSILHLIKIILKTGGKRGLLQGGPLSPLLSNLYLNDIDKMLEQMKVTTQRNGYLNLEYARFADDVIILVDNFRRNSYIVDEALARLREQLSQLGLTLNDEKSRVVDIDDYKQTFSFLGFDFRRKTTSNGKKGVNITLKKQARIKLQRKLKLIFRKKRGCSVQTVVSEINPIVRGWVNYYRIGNSNPCFTLVKDWLEKKVRRHLYRGQHRGGYGWKTWSKRQLYAYFNLYNDYKIRYIEG